MYHYVPIYVHTCLYQLMSVRLCLFVRAFTRACYQRSCVRRRIPNTPPSLYWSICGPCTTSCSSPRWRESASTRRRKKEAWLDSHPAATTHHQDPHRLASRQTERQRHKSNSQCHKTDLKCICPWGRAWNIEVGVVLLSLNFYSRRIKITAVKLYLGKRKMFLILSMFYYKQKSFMYIVWMVREHIND